MIYIPKISPIAITQLRAGDNTPYNFHGIDDVDICHIAKKDEEIIFQFFSDTANPTVSLVSNEILDAITITDITPTGWDGLGNYVYKVSLTPTTEGRFSIYINEDGYFFESEEIKVLSSTDELILIEYANSASDYGFVKNGTDTFKIYQYGHYQKATPINNLDSYKNDRGELVTLRATPQEGYELKLWYCSLADINRLNLVFSLDSIKINNVPFQSPDVIKSDNMERSNMYEATVAIVRVEDDFEEVNTIDDGLEFIGDNTDLILTDNNQNMLIL